MYLLFCHTSPFLPKVVFPLRLARLTAAQHPFKSPDARYVVPRFGLQQRQKLILRKL